MYPVPHELPIFTVRQLNSVDSLVGYLHYHRFHYHPDCLTSNGPSITLFLIPTLRVLLAVLAQLFSHFAAAKNGRSVALQNVPPTYLATFPLTACGLIESECTNSLLCCIICSRHDPAGNAVMK